MLKRRSDCCGINGNEKARMATRRRQKMGSIGQMKVEG
jgi:hypothetical protein